MPTRFFKFGIAVCLIHLFDGLYCTSGNSAAVADDQSFPVSIHVDAGKSLGEMRPIWRFFGADEPNYAYMKDGQKLLGELG